MTEFDRLSELLELGDVERELPGDLEERLLADVLAAASAPAERLDKASVIVPIDGRRESVERPRWRQPWRLAAVAAALIVVVSLAVLTRRPAVEAPSSSPSTVTPTTAAGPFDDLTDDELCTFLRGSSIDAGLLGPSVPIADINASDLQLVADALDEVVERRESEDSAVANAADGVRLAIAELDDGVDGTDRRTVDAAGDQLRAAFPRLADATCDPE